MIRSSTVLSLKPHHTVHVHKYAYMYYVDKYAYMMCKKYLYILKYDQHNMSIIVKKKQLLFFFSTNFLFVPIVTNNIVFKTILLFSARYI